MGKGVETLLLGHIHLSLWCTLSSSALSTPRSFHCDRSPIAGFLSRISHFRTGHRRSQSDRREASEPSSEARFFSFADTIVEFKPVERPTEPLNRDQLLRCPLPEPCILNDGRIWKESMSASARMGTDLSVIEEESESLGRLETSRSRLRSNSMKHVMLPSQSHSAPECNIVNLLEECDASPGI